MRYAAYFIALSLSIPPASAAISPEIDPRASLSVVQQWIYNYRAKPDYAHVPAAVKVPLAEVVEAADTVQLAAVRKDALAAVEELKTKGSDSRRNLDFWGQVGVGAVALGCVSAAALGQIAVGIPCVIGGSASQGLLSFWEKQQ